MPFLARLAGDPHTPQRDEIVHLLVALAIGYDQSHLPAGVDIAGWRARIERMRCGDWAQELRELDLQVRGPGSFDVDEELRGAQHQLAAYDAVRAELPGLRGLLGDGDPWVRAAAARLLGWFPEEAGASAVALRALLAAEGSPGVAANAIVWAGLLQDTLLIPQRAKPRPSR
jgi:hypothetical protein